MYLRNKPEPLTVQELADLLSGLIAQGHGALPIHGGHKIGRDPTFALQKVALCEGSPPSRYPGLEPPPTPYLSITHL